VRRAQSRVQPEPIHELTQLNARLAGEEQHLNKGNEISAGTPASNSFK
jgi:hypothetical protein